MYSACKSYSGDAECGMGEGEMLGLDFASHPAASRVAGYYHAALRHAVALVTRARWWQSG